MTTILYVASCVFVILSLGCIAVTYPTITDNAGDGQFVVNTNGKAHINWDTLQWSVTVDGQRFTHISFVDQGPGDHQKMTTYQLSLAPGLYGFDTPDDTYCNPDWTGCAWFTNEYDPDTVTGCSFDSPTVRLNLNCVNISAVGLCFSSRLGECGRTLHSPGMSSQDLRRLLEEGVPQGNHRLVYTLSSINTAITLTSPSGSVMTPRFAGTRDVTMNLAKGRMDFDFSGVLHEQNLLRIAAIADSEFASGTAHVEHNGVSRDLSYTFLDGEFYRRIARTRY